MSTSTWIDATRRFLRLREIEIEIGRVDLLWTMYVATGGSSGKAYKCIETTAFWQRAMSMRDIRSSGDSTFYYAALCLWDAVGPIHDIHTHHLELFLIHNFQYCSSDLASVSHVGSKIKSPWKRNNEAINCSEVWGSWYCYPIKPGWIEEGRCGECDAF